MAIHRVSRFKVRVAAAAARRGHPYSTRLFTPDDFEFHRVQVRDSLARLSLDKLAVVISGSGREFGLNPTTALARTGARG